MLEFHMFRVKVLLPTQRSLFNSMTRASILRKCIECQPEGALWGGINWHLGDVEALDENAYYFRFGKTTKATLEMFQDGHFEDAEFPTSPYTHAFIDVAIGVAAIAKKTELGRTPNTLGNQLARLLNSCDIVVQAGAKIEVAVIQDPEDFIQYIRSAYRISKFWMTFSLPNPWDANEDFVQPAQKALAQTKGEEGKVEMKGEDLQHEPLEEFARSAATTGDKASIKMQESQEAEFVTKRLQSGAVTIVQDEVSEPEEKLSLLELLRETYRKIRGSGN